MVRLCKIVFIFLQVILLLRLTYSVTPNIGDSEKSTVVEDVKQISRSLNKVLDFINQHYFEMNLDAALGIILTEAQLLQTLENTTNPRLIELLQNFLKKCEIIKKIIPLLQKKSEKNILFSQLLLNPYVWKANVKFQQGQLKDLGIYNFWTIKNISQSRSATYGGVTSDECLIEILQQTTVDGHLHSCSVSPRCKMFMFEKRNDTGYVLTHRLLYLYIIQIVNCKRNKENVARMIRRYCTLILKETKTNVFLGVPQRDLFLEQVVLCGMEGFTEFLQKNWLSKIRQWQTEEGCYKENQTSENHKNIKERSANIISFGCIDHTTGLGAAALALNLRRKYLK